MNFVRPNGEKIEASAKEGDTLLDVIINNNIEIDGFGEFVKTSTYELN